MKGKTVLMMERADKSRDRKVRDGRAWMFPACYGSVVFRKEPRDGITHAPADEVEGFPVAVPVVSLLGRGFLK